MTDRKKNTADSDNYRKLFDSIDKGFCIIQMLFDDDEKPIDYRFLQINAAFEEQTGLKNAEGRRMRELEPQHEEHWFEIYGEVASTGESKRFEHHAEMLENRWFEVNADSFGPVENRQVAVLFSDITKSKYAEEALRESEARQRFLVELNDAISLLSDPVEILETVSETVKNYFGADRCYYCEIENGDAVIRRDASREGLPSVAGVYPLDSFALLKAVVDAGRPFTVDDVFTTDEVDEELRQLCIQLQVVSYVDVPVIKNGRAAGILCLVQSTPRDWTDLEVELVAETAERTWAAVERARAEKISRESEERLLLATEGAEIGIWELDLPEGNSPVHSFRHDRIFGYEEPCEDWNLKVFLDHVHPDDREWVEQDFKDSLRTGEWVFECRIIRADNKQRWIKVRGEFYYDSKGEPARAVGVIRDVTGRRQNEEKLLTLKNNLDAELSLMIRLHELSLRLTSTTELQPMLEEILEAAVELQNADFGSIQLFNHDTDLLEIYAQKEFGQEFEELYSNVIGMQTSCDMALNEGQRIIIENVKTDPRYEKESENALKMGFQAVQSTPLFDRGGNPLGVLSTHFKEPHRPSQRVLRFTDLYARQAADMIELKLTEKKLRTSEKKLQSLNETLEERVEQRTSSLLAYQKQLRSLASQLSKAEEQERHRLASDLHDNLGQMLAVVKMNVELLKKDPGEEIKGISAMLDEAITYTRELMSDLKPPPSIADEDLRVAVEWVANKMKKHDLNVSVEDDSRLKPVREEVRTTLLRSIRELLFNVVKHAGVNNARVCLMCIDDRVQVIVEDKGNGFDVNKSRSPDSLEGGFGLFNISERIDFLGGNFEIESKPGKGTKVKLSFPVKIEKDVEGQPQPQLQPQPQPGTHKIKVLLADDHQIMREGLRKIINEEADLTVAGEAANGREAVEMAREIQPDVIVMDVDMPEMNGIQATRQIKGILPHIHIIALSFHNDKGVAREIRKAGASAYLTKSDAFETLRATIRSEAVSVSNS
jgi:PAS domain S-box-containing protein